MRTRVTLNMSRVDRRIKNNIEKSLFTLSEQVLKDSNTYVPADTWTLRNSSLTSSKPSEGKLIWNTPYARRMYYGRVSSFIRQNTKMKLQRLVRKDTSVHRRNWLKMTT